MTEVILEELVLYTPAPAFKQIGDAITGTYAITGTTVGGANARETSIDIGFIPQYLDVTFGGRSLRGFGIYDDADNEPRENDEWFKEGAVYVSSNGSSLTNYPIPFTPNVRMEGTHLIIRLEYEQQFTDVQTLVSENLYYKIVPYANT